MSGVGFERAGVPVVHLLASEGYGVCALGERFFRHRLVDEPLAVQRRRTGEANTINRSHGLGALPPGASPALDDLVCRSGIP